MGLYYADGKGNAIKISSNSAGKWLPAVWSNASGDTYYMDDGQGDIFFKGRLVTKGEATSIVLPSHTGYKNGIIDGFTPTIENGVVSGQTIYVTVSGNTLKLSAEGIMDIPSAFLQVSYTK